MRPYLDQGPQALADELRKRAPDVMNRGEQMMLSAPDELTARGKAYLTEQLRTQLPAVEAKLFEAVRGVLVAAREKAGEAGVDPNDPRQLEAITQNLTASLGQQMDAVVNKVYQDYARMGDDFLMYLQRLATASDLDRREQLHRQAVISGLAVLERAERDAAAKEAGPGASTAPRGDGDRHRLFVERLRRMNLSNATRAASGPSEEPRSDTVEEGTPAPR
jgi:hypothetical protein